MIRGAIDYIARDRVGGWLFSDESSTKTRTVLAFLDGACIGAGRVEQYREDLAGAGLGDGYVGFNFGIDPVAEDDQVRVTVRLEGSDLQLIHEQASIANRSAAGAFASSAKSAKSIEWMLSQGWLTHDEYDYLRQLAAAGGYERSLRRPKAAGGGIEAAAPIAETYLALEVQNAVTLTEIALADVAELIAEQGNLLSEFACTVVAISAEEKGELIVLKAGPGEGDEPLETPFAVAPDRLLLLDLSAEIAAGGATGSRLKLWGVQAVRPD